MNRHLVSLMVLTIAAAISLLPQAANAQQGHHQHRQYYGNWHGHSSGYAYRPYFYKPHAQFAGFKHHYVIHHPKHPQHLYFYNPYKKQFWGRCSADHGGKPEYSLLAEKDRSGDLEKVPESAFPKPAGLPPLPESTDGTLLDLPPDDLPDITALPGAK